jgi:hypothetical protein
MKKNVIKILYFSIILLLIFTGNVYAYTTFGGKWEDQTFIEYQKDSSVGSYGYGSRVDWGGSQWNPVSSKFDLSATTSSADVKVFAGDTFETSWADTLNYKYNFWGNLESCWNCEYDYSRVRINEPKYKDLSLLMQQKVMTHEFGHVLGLDHATQRPAIMIQGDFDQNTVQQDDKDGILTIYGQ